MNVEVVHFVTRAGRVIRSRLRRVRGLGPVDTVRPHVLIDAFDRSWIASQQPAPVFRMGVVDLLFVAVDEGLKDAADVRADGGCISRAILLRHPGETHSAERERGDC